MSLCTPLWPLCFNFVLIWPKIWPILGYWIFAKEECVHDIKARKNFYLINILLLKSFRPLWCCLCSIVYTINQNQQPVMWWWLIQIFAATSPVKDSGRDASNFWPRKCIFGRSVTLLVLVSNLQHLVNIFGLTLSIENYEYGWNLCQKRKFRIQKFFLDKFCPVSFFS